MTTQQQREVFERQWLQDYDPRKLARKQSMGGDLRDEYKDPRADLAWEFFQEGVKWQAAQQVQGEVE